MYKTEVNDVRDLAVKHELAPEIAVMIIKVADDIIKKLNMPVGLRPEVMHLVATSICKETRLLEQEGLMP